MLVPYRLDWNGFLEALWATLGGHGKKIEQGTDMTF
jgi:hypothetical protein